MITKENTLTFFMIDFDNDIICNPFTFRKYYDFNLNQVKGNSVYGIYHNEMNSHLANKDNIFVFNELLSILLENVSIRMKNYSDDILKNIIEAYSKKFSSQKEKENHLSFLYMLYNFSYLKKLNPVYFQQKKDKIFLYKITKNLQNKTLQIEKTYLDSYIEKFENILYRNFRLPYFVNITDVLTFWSFNNMMKLYEYHKNKFCFSFFERIGEKRENLNLKGNDILEFIKNRFFQQIVFLNKIFKNDKVFYDLKNKQMLTVLGNKNNYYDDMKHFYENFKDAFRCEKKNMKKFIIYGNNFFGFSFSVLLKNTENKNDILLFLKSMGVLNIGINNHSFFTTDHNSNQLVLLSYVQDLNFFVEIGSLLR